MEENPKVKQLYSETNAKKTVVFQQLYISYKVFFGTPK